MNSYRTLGLKISKYNQIALFIFSILIIGLNLIIGSEIIFWIFMIMMLLIINLIWYSFSDVKWSKEKFIVEKFLMKKEIPFNEFLSVDRLILGIFVIKFTNNKFYYIGGIKSFFTNTTAITNEIKNNP
jgi:hypothetical protein